MAEGKAAIAQQMKHHAPKYLLVELGFKDIAWNLGSTPPEPVAAGVISSMQQLGDQRPRGGPERPDPARRRAAPGADPR